MRRRSIIFVLVFALLTGMTANFVPYTGAAAATSDTIQDIILYHTNDVHGNQDKGIGIATVAALKKNTEASLLVDAGDATQGLALATLSKGENIIELMNLAGYDAMATGNHEFDYGQEQLLKNCSLTKFPILGANVKKDGQPFLQGAYDGGINNGEYTVIEKAGVKIGIFGLTTQNTRTSSNPAGLTGITFEDEVETAERMIDKLEEEKADIIVCLAHLGDSNSSAKNTANDVAAALTGEYYGKLDAIIDGHSHTEENAVVNGVTISQTGNALAKVGKMTFSYDRQSGRVQVKTELLTADDCKNVEPDETISARLREMQDLQSEQLDIRVADTNTTLWGGTIHNVTECRITEQNLGNLITDSMIDAGQDIIRDGNVSEQYRDLPIIAVENGGGIRSTIRRGTITKGDIINVLPFGNVVSFKAITPKLLYEILEASVSANTAQDEKTGLLTSGASGNFLQVGGFKFTYNPNLPESSRVLEVILNGETTSLTRDDESRQIILASNDYLIAAGDKYAMLKNLPTVAEGGALDVMLENIILKLTEQGTKPLSLPTTEGRITIKSNYQPGDYTAYLEIKNENREPAANQVVSWFVDESPEGKTGQTDENGLLAVTVSDGPHTIRLEEGINDAYICNYTGSGILTTYTGTYPDVQVKSAGLKPIPSPSETPDANPTAPPESFLVTLDTGTGKTSVLEITDGDKMAPPASKPAKRGYTFLGWYHGTEKYDFSSPVKSNLTLTAKWKKVVVKKTKIVSKKENGKKITVSIKKITGAAGYQAKAATSKNLKKNSVSVSGQSNKLIFKKWSNKKCYVRVRAYKLDSMNKRVYGKWSNVKRIK